MSLFEIPHFPMMAFTGLWLFGTMAGVLYTLSRVIRFMQS